MSKCNINDMSMIISQMIEEEITSSNIDKLASINILRYKEFIRVQTQLIGESSRESNSTLYRINYTGNITKYNGEFKIISTGEFRDWLFKDSNKNKDNRKSINNLRQWIAGYAEYRYMIIYGGENRIYKEEISNVIEASKKILDAIKNRDVQKIYNNRQNVYSMIYGILSDISIESGVLSEGITKLLRSSYLYDY